MHGRGSTFFRREAAWMTVQNRQRVSSLDKPFGSADRLQLRLMLASTEPITRL